MIKRNTLGQFISGSKQPRFCDITGKKFGRLRVIKLHHGGHQAFWLCKCDCGKETIVAKQDITSGHTTSCGCYHKERFLASITTHGMRHTNFYSKWAGIKQRCLNKNNKRFNEWGGRGIKICDRWLKFENFRDDMYKSYQEHVEKHGIKQTSLDRINVNGDYEPSNCKWATWKEQFNNRRCMNKSCPYYHLLINGRHST